MDRRRLAVHYLRRAHDLPAEYLADALVAETDTEDREALASQLKDRSRAHTRVLGPARAGDTSNAGGLQGPQASHVDGIVADHDRLGSELAEVLHEVVDEAVVVVDDRHPHAHRRRGYRSRESWVSSRVVAKARAGSDGRHLLEEADCEKGPGHADKRPGQADKRPGQADKRPDHAAQEPGCQQALHRTDPQERQHSPGWYGPLLLVLLVAGLLMIVGNYVGSCRRHEQLVPHRWPGRDRGRGDDGHAVPLRRPRLVASPLSRVLVGEAPAG